MNTIYSYLFVLLFSCCDISSGDGKVAVSIDFMGKHQDLQINNDQAKDLVKTIDGIYVQQKAAITYLLASAVCGKNKQFAMEYRIDYTDQNRTIRLICGTKSTRPKAVDYKGFDDHVFDTTQFTKFIIRCSQQTAFNQIAEIATK